MPKKIEDESEVSTVKELNTIERSILEARVIEQIQTVYDPEIPVNVYDLGLIYDVDVSGDRAVAIQMTLTSPACPVAESLPLEVEQAVRGLAEVSEVKVELVWDPPFTIDRVPDHIKLMLGLY